MKKLEDLVDESAKALIQEFKKRLPSKDEVRKKNYIGDSVIAEKNEEDEDEQEGPRTTQSN